MATLALAGGGAAIGGFFGGPLGAQAGWLIGSLIGSLLFPEDGPEARTEGPRLGDQTFSASAYGAPIPLGYGSMRMSGNMIWAEEREEVKTVTETEPPGGKGGSQPVNTAVTYTYFQTFAMAFAQGPAADVIRMWADSKLIYDKTGTQDDIAKHGLNFRFYPGSETQGIDSLIRDDKGDDAPAYRGTCYIVFDRLALADFGNRIPNITAEIAFQGSTSQPVDTIDLYTTGEGGIAPGTFQSDNILPDYTRGQFYFSNASGVVGENYIRRANTRTMVEDRQNTLTLDDLGNDADNLSLQIILDNGFILINTTSGNGKPISLIDPNTLEIVSTFGVDAAGFSNSPTQFEALGNGLSIGLFCQTLLGIEFFALTGSSFNSLGVLKVTGGTLEYIWDSDEGPGVDFAAANDKVLGCSRGVVGDGFCVGYVLGGPTYGGSSQPDNVNLYSVTILSTANYFSGSPGAWSGVSLQLVKSYAPGDLIPGETELTTAKGPVYDETDDTVMIQVQAEDAMTNFMIKIDPDNGDIIWSSEIPGIRSEISGFNHSRIQDNLYGQVDTDRAWAIQTSTGEVIYDQAGWAPDADSSGSMWWDSRTLTAVSADVGGLITKYFFLRGDGLGEGLDTIVEDLCVRAGLELSQVDVSDLAGITVPGYMVARQSTARGSLTRLTQAYLFDGVESDWVLKFILRDGKAVEADITQDELAFLDNAKGEYFVETRVQEVELPTRLTLTYMDRDKDYQQAAHNSKRILDPIPTMSSRNEMGLQLPIALSADTAKQLSEKALYSAWNERSTYSVQLPWTYLALDPSDVITISLDSGTTFRTRLIQSDIGLSFTLDIQGLSEEAAQYTSTVAADAGNSGLVQTFLPEVATKLLMLNSTLLRDSDDNSRTVSNQYFAMGGYGQPGWTAAILFKSIEGTQWTQEGSIVAEMAWGSTQAALGDTDTPFQTDEVNTLRVYMNTGADQLTSVTQLEMLNGANPAMVINSAGEIEVIQFRDVEVNPDESRTLSGLLRGRRGTDTLTGIHAAGDTFLLLNTSSASRLSLSLDGLNQTRFYRGVTVGQRFEGAMPNSNVSPGNDLKPYAVVGHTATLVGGNDIDLTWKRRTRLGGALQDGTGTVPLNEDTEEYELEIFDGPGGSEVREVTGLTTPDYTYTSADQITDGFTPPLSEITIRVYQISAQVGRGFFKEVTIDVE